MLNEQAVATDATWHLPGDYQDETLCRQPTFDKRVAIDFDHVRRDQPTCSACANLCR